MLNHSFPGALGRFLLALFFVICLDHLLDQSLKGIFGNGLLDSYNGYIELSIVRLLEIGAFCIVYRQSFLSIVGFHGVKTSLKHAGWGFGISGLGLLLFLLIDWGLQALSSISLREMVVGEVSNPKVETKLLFLSLMVHCIIGPFAEELFFRAYLIRLIGPARTPLLAKIFFEILLILAFAIPHILLLGISIDSIWLIIWSLCGFIMIRLYCLTQSILTGFIIHGMANGSIYLMGQGML